jgi:carbon storage regulator
MNHSEFLSVLRKTSTDGHVVVHKLEVMTQPRMRYAARVARYSRPYNNKSGKTNIPDRAVTKGCNNMLVLSRKQSQSIIINGNIRITVVSIRGNQVRIGVEAPASVPVFREELCEPVTVSNDQPRLAVPGSPAHHGPVGSRNAFVQTPLRDG